MWRLGYTSRGLKVQTLLTWIVVAITYLVTDPAENINWLWRPFGVEQHLVPPIAVPLAAMLAVPLILYLPTHALLAVAFGNRSKVISSEREQ